MSHLFRFILETKESKKDETFFFWGGRRGCLNHAKMSKLIVLSWLGTDGKFNPPTTLKNRKCSMHEVPQKMNVYYTL